MHRKYESHISGCGTYPKKPGGQIAGTVVPDPAVVVSTTSVVASTVVPVLGVSVAATVVASVSRLVEVVDSEVASEVASSAVVAVNSVVDLSSSVVE